ncbi:MAG TPA: tetratricopeptide repeat protein [Ktedonobacterales bacterium]
MDATVPLSFGELLTRYRAAAHLTQAELAERAQLSERAVRKLERGESHVPRADTLHLLIDALALSPEQEQRLRETARARRGRASAVAAALPLVMSALPIAPSPLFGREGELATTLELLRREPVRLLTLTGMGGVGKTHLALELAHALEVEFADGARFVSLAPLRDPLLVCAALAGALGLRETGQTPLAELVQHSLRDKRLLLLLDNFEHVIQAAPFVADLLATCPRLKVLVTSRVPLHLRAEQEYLLAPLALPDASTTMSVAALEQVPSVRLFLQRVQAVLPAFTLSAANAGAILAICQRLDGLPLALELAAARSRALAPQALLERLDARLALLTDGARDLPARQRTLRDTLGWSYDLLSAEAQLMFRRLAVFAGGCTLTAAQAVCASAQDSAHDEGSGVFDTLCTLVDHHLLRARPGGSAGDQRFDMLETVREYAWEQLCAHGEEENIRRAHAAHFLAFAEAAEPHLSGSEQTAWLSRLDEENDNLRSALHWAQERNEVTIGLRIAGALWRFWTTRGHLGEGERWLEWFLGRARSYDRTDIAAVRAKALNGAGLLAQQQGDYRKAFAWHEENFALRRSLGDHRGVASSLNNLGLIARDLGNFRRAAQLWEESLAILRELDDQWASAIVLHNLGRLAHLQGDGERAATLLHESVTQLRALGDRWGTAIGLSILGEVACACGAIEAATSFCEESLLLLHDLDDPFDTAIALMTLGHVAYAQKDYLRARAFYEEALVLRRDVGDKPGIGEALLHVAHTARSLGDHARALTLYRQSLALHQRLGIKRHVAPCLEGLAEITGAQQRMERAVRLLSLAAKVRDDIGIPLPPAERPVVDEIIALARAALGGRQFVNAWLEGEALSLAQAVDLALDRFLIPNPIRAMSQFRYPLQGHRGRSLARSPTREGSSRLLCSTPRAE